MESLKKAHPGINVHAQSISLGDYDAPPDRVEDNTEARQLPIEAYVDPETGSAEVKNVALDDLPTFIQHLVGISNDRMAETFNAYVQGRLLGADNVQALAEDFLNNVVTTTINALEMWELLNDRDPNKTLVDVMPPELLSHPTHQEGMNEMKGHIADFKRRHPDRSVIREYGTAKLHDTDDSTNETEGKNTNG